MPDGIDVARRLRLKLEGCSKSSGRKGETSMLSSGDDRICSCTVMIGAARWMGGGVLGRGTAEDLRLQIVVVMRPRRIVG